MTVRKEDDESVPYYRIQSVDRALSILKCFIVEKRALGVSELARMLGLNKSAVHRFLLTLKDHGFVEQVRDSDRYMIGATAFELGSVYTNSTELTVEGKKVLGELVKQTGCLSHLAIMDQNSVLYLVNVEPDHQQYLFGAIGQRRPIYRTALGKSLTAWLPEEQVREKLKACSFESCTPHTIRSLDQFILELEQVRRTGLAMDREESTIGVRCVSAPVRNKFGEVIAAISVSGFGLEEAKLIEYGFAVKSSAAQLSRRLGNTAY